MGRNEETTRKKCFQSKHYYIVYKFTSISVGIIVIIEKKYICLYHILNLDDIKLFFTKIEQF